MITDKKQKQHLVEALYLVTSASYFMVNYTSKLFTLKRILRFAFKLFKNPGLLIDNHA